MVSHNTSHRHHTAGYTLILVAALLIAFAAISAVTLRDKANTEASHQSSDTHMKLEVIRTALERYHATNGELPCPAPLNIAANPVDMNYGAPADCSLAAPAGITEVSSTNVWVGMVPFRVIGVSPDTVLDNWGNKIMYAIDNDLAGAPTNIDVEDASGNAIGSYQYAIYSLGADGVGAWAANATAVATGCSSSATDLREENCDDDTLFIDTPILSSSSVEASEYFDDTILYASHLGSGVITCPTDTLSWGAGCSAEFTSIVDGATSPTTSNIAAGYNGNATAYCNAGTWDTPAGTCTAAGASCTASSGSTKYWDASASGCYGYLPTSLTDGNSDTINNLNGYLTGHITVSCSSGTYVYSGAMCECFVAGTQITLADGSSKNIEELAVGDVLKGHEGDNTVLTIRKIPVETRTSYGFNGGKAFVTGGHPFYTKDGWKAVDPALTGKEGHDVLTGKLEVGDEILREDGSYLRIESIKSETLTNSFVYNPSVGGDDTYYADGYLVHNK